MIPYKHDIKTVVFLFLVMGMLILICTSFSISLKLKSIQISLNEASFGDLQALPGLGIKRAWLVYSYRCKHGLFQNLEDLLLISGIGHKTLIKLKKYLQK